jgi:hypothetical protein
VALGLASTVIAAGACKSSLPEPPANRAAWEARSEELREEIKERLGFTHLPERSPPEAVIWGRLEYSRGYTIENVYFESFPGFFVTGNLYRPVPADREAGDPPRSRAGILHTHGHFGAIGTLVRSRTSMIAACATLARMGAVVFTYDMVGFGDSQQMKHPDWDHDPPEKSIAATVQTWDSIRALDFLLSLPEVDPARVGITGPSGGGSQAMALTALDPRITASAPVVMVSHIKSGGCPCEMGYVPRELSDGTMEIAAMAAPRPQLVVSDGGDWTHDVPHVEFPFLREVYALYGAAGRVSNVHLLSEDHDYGPDKRAAVYPFFQQALDLDEQPPPDPHHFPPEDVTLPGDTLHAFDDDHPRPPHALMGADAVKAGLEAYLGVPLHLN